MGLSVGCFLDLHRHVHHGCGIFPRSSLHNILSDMKNICLNSLHIVWRIDQVVFLSSGVKILLSVGRKPLVKNTGNYEGANLGGEGRI